MMSSIHNHIFPVQEGPWVLTGFLDQVATPPAPNDLRGTVNGCASAIWSHDEDGDGAIRRGEYLDFANSVAGLLCLPPRPILDLEMQTIFVSIACLCQEREGNDITCCFGENAGLYVAGASSVTNRTQEEASYLTAACLLTQAVLGPEQCDTPVSTINPDGEWPAMEVTPGGSNTTETGGAPSTGILHSTSATNQPTELEADSPAVTVNPTQGGTANNIFGIPDMGIETESPTLIEEEEEGPTNNSTPVPSALVENEEEFTNNSTPVPSSSTTNSTADLNANSPAEPANATPGSESAAFSWARQSQGFMISSCLAFAYIFSTP